MKTRQHYFYKTIGKRASETNVYDSAKRGRFVLLEPTDLMQDSDDPYNERAKDSCIGGTGCFGTGIALDNSNSLVALDGKWSRDGIQQDSTYKIKFMTKNSPQVIFDEDSEERKMQASDLAILCNLQHEHIVKVHGISSVREIEPYVVLDKMACNLAGKIREWSVKGRHSNLRERLCIFHALASALDLIHEKRVLYRGLDPCTVGFDGNGTVKLFDFSLAKRLTDDSSSFLLTVMAGSPLYMAPEVQRGEPYGPSVDVFSLCVLAWEIIMLEHISFGDKAKYVDVVLRHGQRPDIPLELPLILRNILRYGWAKKPLTRPTIKVIRTAMDQFLYSKSLDSPENEYIQVILQSNGTFLEF